MALMKRPASPATEKQAIRGIRGSINGIMSWGPVDLLLAILLHGLKELPCCPYGYFGGDEGPGMHEGPMCWVDG